jgi:glycosyltransferase involved in cell wall biosynthesis
MRPGGRSRLRSGPRIKAEMSILHWISGGFLGVAWVSRVFGAALGMPKIADVGAKQWDRWPPASPEMPRVSIIVPACNEEETIGDALEGLLQLEYPNYEVIAVNDRSTDRTGECMERVAGLPAAMGKLRVLHVTDLPPGWLGKTHAMWTAGKQATGDWLLFTDADVFFRAETLRRVLAYAEAEPADHVVLFPTMIMKTPGERMMIAFFQTLFVFGHRPWKVADPETKDHMGVGAFNLVRRRVYEAVGTYRALRMEVLDDMKLGKVVKQAGFAQRNVFGDGLISLRWAKGAIGVVRNLTKNFFAVLSYQWWRVLAGLVALAYMNLMPFVGIWLAAGWSRAGYGLALLSMFLIYAGMSLRSRIPPYYFFLHPVSTTLFAYTLLRSMVRTLRDGGVRWRGTLYPLEELRKGLV